MIVLLTLSAISLFLVITKTLKNHTNNKFLKQFGLAILVGIITINNLITNNSGTALKYAVIGIGIMSFIAILTEIIIFKKKQTTS
ncbi:hypothetical protein M948_21035 [Virgibacillus sp. CM-4]|uniref:Uncharacterized protein n=1 Tax=Virgibacillus massiliensis TaxID=1462526 RepID=A0A024QFU8_9BACI|nr:hypothetical protein M948_21035 [Virgibacillus sp. CM-4]CDQ41374.1 hypothetical protein BN990_03744 [Virgibacillus massiliensis]